MQARNASRTLLYDIYISIKDKASLEPRMSDVSSPVGLWRKTPDLLASSSPNTRIDDPIRYASPIAMLTRYPSRPVAVKVLRTGNCVTNDCVELCLT